MDSCSNIVQFFENKTLFVTGATGFLAKVFIEEVLRIQPSIKKLYLLVRAPDVKSATQRIRKEVLGKDLFKVLKETLGANADSFFYEKIALVIGDTSVENLGVSDLALRDEIWRTTDIVVNCAATTNFDERYDVAFSVNTMGVLNVLNFAKKCHRIKMLLHVSTAYVCGEASGLIMEKPFCMGEVLKGKCRLDIDVEKKLVDEKMNQLLSSHDAKGPEPGEVAVAMKNFGLERARFYGWPNTYVFTKAMGEMLLGEFRDNLPIVIIRPTIITSTYKEPFPGYIEGLRTLDSFIGLTGKGKVSCFLANPNTILDTIPVDMLVNSMLVAMYAHWDQYSENVKMYQVGSSSKNPLKASNIRDFTNQYFTQNPWINREGNPVSFRKMKFYGSMASFRNYMTIRYVLPLKVFGVVNEVSCQLFFHSKCKNLGRKISLAMRMVELYKPYVLFEGIFDDTNREKLIKLMETRGGFNMDPKCIDWEDYFLNTHIPGLVKYVIK